MKLVFYSGGQQTGNWDLHQDLIELTGKRKRVSFTYIPFCSDNADWYYRRAIKRYQKFGASKFQCLQVDLPKAPSQDEVKKALDSDIVYLAGGNTFYFLSWLKKRRLLGALRKYSQDGGVIAGLSAGAHIMTPHIGLAGLPGFDPDKNEVGLKSLSALNLVGFEFMPHFRAKPRELKLLTQYSSRSKTTIYGCADGGGIVMNGNSFTLHGRVWVFYGNDWVRLT